MMCRRTPDEAIIKQVAVFISSHFKMPLRARGDDEGRPPGQLRVLIRQLGYSDYEITRWLWHGEEPGPGLPPMTLAWAALIEGHLALGSCNCAEEERQRHPHRRADYIQRKGERCCERHALAQQPGSGLNLGEFVYRAAVGVKEPMSEIRGFIDSMLFPLIETPGERNLTWERVPGPDGQVQTIVVEWHAPGQFYDPDGGVPDAPERTRLPVLICRKCGKFVGPQGNDVCRNGQHLWELASLELDEEELAGDVNSRMHDIPISCCPNDDKNRWPHIWHGDGPVRCPACDLRRRTGKRHRSIRVYVPLSNRLLPP